MCEIWDCSSIEIEDEILLGYIFEFVLGIVVFEFVNLKLFSGLYW